jgi:hypothetical protein
MKGETVTCNALLTNTLEGTAKISFGNFTVTDDNGKTYKKKSHGCSYGSTTIKYGESLSCDFTFPLVEPSAAILSLSGTINANNGSDALAFESITILK